MLPEKDLVYPGAIEVWREFIEEDIGRTVDGNPFNRPAELHVDFRFDREFDFEAVRGWYRDNLTNRGWEVASFGPKEQSATFKRSSAAWSTSTS